jgi:thioredoxin 1
VGALWLAGLPVAAVARPQLLEFWASWCGTCRAMEPTVAALKKRWGDRIEVRIVDVDDPKNAELLRRYRIPGTAIFVLLDRDGREVFRESGQVPQAVFEAEFKKVLGA